MQRSPDPSPQQIAEACRRIRATWSEAERRKRLRPDWRNGEATTSEVPLREFAAAVQAAQR